MNSALLCPGRGSMLRQPGFYLKLDFPTWRIWLKRWSWNQRDIWGRGSGACGCTPPSPKKGKKLKKWEQWTTHEQNSWYHSLALCTFSRLFIQTSKAWVTYWQCHGDIARLVMLTVHHWMSNFRFLWDNTDYLLVLLVLSANSFVGDEKTEDRLSYELWDLDGRVAVSRN